MGMTFLDARAIAQMLDQNTQRILVSWIDRISPETTGIGVLTIFAIGEVAPACAPGRFAQKHRPAFAALRATGAAVFHQHLARLEIDIADLQRGQFDAHALIVGITHYTAIKPLHDTVCNAARALRYNAPATNRLRKLRAD